MKVLHLSGATSWGGNEQQLVDLIFGLEKQGVTNLLFCFKNSPLEDYAKNNELNHFSITKAKGHSLQLAKILKGYVVENSPNIIHLHTSNSVTMFVISDLFFRLKTPAVFSKKGIGSSESFLSIIKYNYKNIKKIICVSKYVKQMFKTTLKRNNHHKLCVIHDGVKIERSQEGTKVNLREQFKISKEKKIIGSVANHTKAKDLVTFVETANELINNLKLANVCFILIGKESKHSSTFMTLINKYKLENHIIITGFLNNAFGVIPQFDIFLITSQREGGPSSGLEAIYNKVPIVSTKVGVMPEIINHGVNGFLASIKDAKSLAENLKTLIYSDDDLQKQFVDKSYNILMKNFTSKDIASKTKQIYNEVLIT